MDFGSAVIETINNSDLENIKVKTFGYDDCFVEHGQVEELEKLYNISVENIVSDIEGIKYNIEDTDLN